MKKWILFVLGVVMIGSMKVHAHHLEGHFVVSLSQDLLDSEIENIELALKTLKVKKSCDGGCELVTSPILLADGVPKSESQEIYVRVHLNHSSCRWLIDELIATIKQDSRFILRQKLELRHGNHGGIDPWPGWSGGS